MTRVLLPLDGSPLAEEAIPLAREAARALDATVSLLSVYPVDRAGAELGGIVAYPEGEGLDHVVAYLDETAKNPTLSGLQVERDVRLGPVADQIAEYAEDKAPDVVVLSTHGAGRATRRPRGRVADELVRTLPVPVLVSPPGKARDQIRKVLVALDGSADGDRVLPIARKIAEGAGASTHLLIVVDAEPAFQLDPDVSGKVTGDLRDAAARHLNAVAVRGEETAVVEGHAVDAILDYADAQGCDLIAMATHGRSGRARLDLGSVADGVLSSADRPVLLVRI